MEIKLSKSPSGGWLAFGRVYEGVLPGVETVQATGASRKEADSRCREQLERLIHARTCGAE